MAKTSLFDIAIWVGLGYVGYKYVLPKLRLGQPQNAPTVAGGSGTPAPAGSSTRPSGSIVPSATGIGYDVIINGIVAYSAMDASTAYSYLIQATRAMGL